VGSYDPVGDEKVVQISMEGSHARNDNEKPRSLLQHRSPDLRASDCAEGFVHLESLVDLVPICSVRRRGATFQGPNRAHIDSLADALVIACNI